MNAPTYQQVLVEAEMLSPEEQLALIARLAEQLPRRGICPSPPALGGLCGQCTLPFVRRGRTVMGDPDAAARQKVSKTVDQDQPYYFMGINAKAGSIAEWPPLGANARVASGLPRQEEK